MSIQSYTRNMHQSATHHAFSRLATATSSCTCENLTVHDDTDSTRSHVIKQLSRASQSKVKPAILLQRKMSGSWPNCSHTNGLSQPQMPGLQFLRQLEPDQFNFTTLILIV